MELRAFIADAPARSWTLNHFGHTSSNPCSKCRVIGTRYEDQMVFMGINHRLRTDDEYSQLEDENHHKGPTPLTRLPMGMVSQVPVEYNALDLFRCCEKIIDCLDYWKVWKKIEITRSKARCYFKKTSTYCTVLSARICKKAKITG